MTVQATTADVVARARQSLGASEQAIYDLVGALLGERGAHGVLVDAGCGSGALSRQLTPAFTRIIGVDAVRYEGLPADVEFRQADLDRDRLPVDDATADATVAVETIEHLENPRRLARELTRVTRPGGWIVITTPNQLSLLNLLTLGVKRRHSAFQDSAYPAHITALLEVDLRRIAGECGWRDVAVRYTARGRVPFTGAHYPRALSRGFPRALSDNVAVIGRKG